MKYLFQWVVLVSEWRGRDIVKNQLLAQEYLEGRFLQLDQAHEPSPELALDLDDLD